MLSNNTFLETRIQRLLDGLCFGRKRTRVHLQRMLKMSRVYKLAEILSKIFVKNEGKLGTLLQEHEKRLLSICFALFVENNA